LSLERSGGIFWVSGNFRFVSYGGGAAAGRTLSWLRHKSRWQRRFGLPRPDSCRGTPEPAKQRAFAGLRRGLLFEKPNAQDAQPGLRLFFEVAKRDSLASSVLLSILQRDALKA